MATKPKTKKKKTATIAFEYKISPNYNVYTISGIHGGLNAHGDIIANIFCERPAIPKKTVHEIKDNKTLGELIKQEKKDSIIRDVIFGLSINPSIARSVASWLNQKADEYEEVVKSQLKEINDENETQSRH